jgi:hypothetical protein
MGHIRVLVAEMPTLHADIVRRIIAEQPDMVIVGEVGAGGPVREVVERTDPDVLLVATSGDELPCSSLALVLVRPWLRVLTLGPDSRLGSVIVETQLHDWPRDGWHERLVEAVRHEGAPRPNEPGGSSGPRAEGR